MKNRILDRDFVDSVASLSQSNQMDTEEQSWGAMCNLLAELADGDIDDAAHKRRLKRAGFSADAELCARMSTAIIKRARKMSLLAGRLTLTALIMDNSEKEGECDE